MTKEYIFLVYRWVKSFQNSGSIFSQKIHNALSKLNNLEYIREKEIQAVMEFEKAIKEASKEYYEDPMGIPALSPWITVRSVLPEFSDKFAKYVSEDNQ